MNLLHMLTDIDTGLQAHAHCAKAVSRRVCKPLQNKKPKNYCPELAEFDAAVDAGLVPLNS